MSTSRISRPRSQHSAPKRFSLTGPRTTPVSQPSHNSPLDSVGPILVWAGSDKDFEARVRDHAQAAGMQFTADSSHPGTGIIVCDPKTLPNVHKGNASALIVVTDEEPCSHTWRTALEHGAMRVRRMPQESAGFLHDLTTLAQQPSPSQVFVCTPGSGGAGASSLAARLARAATKLGANPVLIDADPTGGGLDVLVESAHTRGARWDALTHAGDGAATAILESLPVIDGIRVLTFPPARSAITPPASDAIVRVCHALSAAAELVIIDVPASPDLVTHMPPHTLLMQTVGTGHALSAAKRRIDALQSSAYTHPISLSLRHPRTHRLYRAQEVESMLGAEVTLEFATSPSTHVPSMDTRRSGADIACLQYLRQALA